MRKEQWDGGVGRGLGLFKTERKWGATGGWGGATSLQTARLVAPTTRMAQPCHSPTILPIHPLFVTKKKTTPKRVWSFAYTVDNCRVQKSALGELRCTTSVGAGGLCRPLASLRPPREWHNRAILPPFCRYIRPPEKERTPHRNGVVFLCRPISLFASLAISAC